MEADGHISRYDKQSATFYVIQPVLVPERLAPHRVIKSMFRSLGEGNVLTVKLRAQLSNWIQLSMADVVSHWNLLCLSRHLGTKPLRFWRSVNPRTIQPRQPSQPSHSGYAEMGASRDRIYTSRL